MDKGIIPWFIVLLPFAGFFINIFFGRFFSRLLVSIFACASVFIAFILSANIFLGILQGGNGYASKGINWIHILGTGHLGEFNINLELWVDQLTCVMILVITGVGFVIHLYSTGYMAEDPRYHRYFAYLNLFTGFMLILVMAKNLLLMFVGWEGVGLCSYLLIGFWFDDKKKGLANSMAGMKAFLVNRVGDLGFTVGMLLLFVYIGSQGLWTLDINNIKHKVEEMQGKEHKHEERHDHKKEHDLDIDESNQKGKIDVCVVTLICILLFVGACGKSAQIPLYVWLPDAMAGPTPVSALIHAATMVTAGVYMVCRLGFLYSLSPVASTVIAVVGVATAIFAATMGICQNDIKKVLAYSTISQLGFMFLAAGVGAYTAAIFHLMTHAFFKACLFLGSGSVIHGTGDQDIRHMGGLRSKMPKTFWTFLIATAAICGIPPLSGFFSKDEILLSAFQFQGIGPLLWFLGLIAAFCTAFYMSRLLFLTFGGEYRGHHHVHESPWVMTLPLIILAILALVGGFVGIPGANVFEKYLDPVFHHHSAHPSTSLIIALMAAAIVVSLAGIYLAWTMYVRRPEMPKRITEKIQPIYNLVANKYHVDEGYQTLIVKPIQSANLAMARFDNQIIDGTVNFCGDATAAGSNKTGYFDNQVIDGTVNLVADSTGLTGQKLRKIQTGNIKSYIAFAVAGGIVIITIFCGFYLLRNDIYEFIKKFIGQ